MTHAPVEPIVPITGVTPLADIRPTTTSVGPSFAQTLLQGMDKANDKLVKAEHLLAAFATDESIPVHQVTYALETARMDFEVAMQVRGKMLEAYQQLMSMQI